MTHALALTAVHGYNAGLLASLARFCMVHVQPPPALVVRVRHKKRRWPLIILVALAWFASIGAALLLTQQTENLVDRAEINRAHKEQDALLQRIAVLERSEQVARAAYGDLQQNLKDRQEEISALRADLAFYSRLTNGSKLEALNVHGVHLQAAASPRVYNFSVTLTQTLKSGQIATGHMRVSVNGVRDGKLVNAATGPNSRRTRMDRVCRSRSNIFNKSPAH